MQTEVEASLFWSWAQDWALRMLETSLRGLREGCTTLTHRCKERVCSELMATAQEKRPASREELERILSSACFARSEGLSRLLRFLVERQLDGRDSELKESLIGVEVYGRRPDYDPKLDSTVRSEMARLRARLSKYYSTEGIQDTLVIDLPKGGYVPGFREPELGIQPAAQ